MNGWEMELGQLQAITGFVPQDDIVHEVRLCSAACAAITPGRARPARAAPPREGCCIFYSTLRPAFCCMPPPVPNKPQYLYPGSPTLSHPVLLLPVVLLAEVPLPTALPPSHHTHLPLPPFSRT